VSLSIGRILEKLSGRWNISDRDPAAAGRITGLRRVGLQNLAYEVDERAHLRCAMQPRAASLGGQTGGAFASELRPERGLASVAGSSAFTAIDHELYPRPRSRLTSNHTSLTVPMPMWR
jgi:hypothetical protein